MWDWDLAHARNPAGLGNWGLSVLCVAWDTKTEGPCKMNSGLCGSGDVQPPWTEPQTAVQKRIYSLSPKSWFGGNTSSTYQNSLSNLFALWRKTSHPCNLNSYCALFAAPNNARRSRFARPVLWLSHAKKLKLLQENTLYVTEPNRRFPPLISSRSSTSGKQLSRSNVYPGYSDSTRYKESVDSHHRDQRTASMKPAWATGWIPTNNQGAYMERKKKERKDKGERKEEGCKKKESRKIGLGRWFSW